MDRTQSVTQQGQFEYDNTPMGDDTEVENYCNQNDQTVNEYVNDINCPSASKITPAELTNSPMV